MLIVVLNLLIWLVVAGIIWWAANAILGLLAPYIAEPFNTIIKIVLIVLVALILISAILQLSGAGGSLGLRLPMLR